MQQQNFDTIRRWYRSYMAGFTNHSSELAGIIGVKLGHIERVVKEMDALTGTLDLTASDRLLARTIAQLHDVARPRQLEEYGTFEDAKSENHALLAVRIINEEKVLDHLPSDEQELIRTAIANHNRYEIADDLDDRTSLFCKLIRDADKLDIWRVFIEAEQDPDSPESTTIFFNLPEKPEATPVVVEAIRKRHVAEYRVLKTRNDFRLLVLGWVYDLSFPHSLRCVRERGYVQTLADKLPDTPSLNDLVAQITGHMAHRIEGGTSSKRITANMEGAHG